MNRQCKLAEGIGGRFVQLGLCQALGCSPETNGQGHFLISVAQRAQQAQDFIGTVASGADDAQRGSGFEAASLHFFEQQTIELATVFGAFRVDTAPAAVQRGAGLIKMRSAERRARNENGDAERAKPHRVILLLQFNIGKDHAVATKAAFQTKWSRIVG